MISQSITGLAGSTLSVGLDEPDTSTVSWLVSVFARVGDGGFFRVGDPIATTPPRASGYAGKRLVALVNVPGVAEWRVEAVPSTPGRPGTLALESALSTQGDQLLVSLEGPPPSPLPATFAGPSAAIVGNPGATLAIGLDEPDGSTVAWVVTVFAQIGEAGYFRAGPPVVTTPPATSGFPGKRLVALAGVPGASSWRVDARPAVISSPGALTLSAAQDLGGVLGVTPADGPSGGGTGGGPATAVWVDGVGGDDATAAAGDVSKPAKTIGKGLALASALGISAVVEVYPATYNEAVAIDVGTLPLMGVVLAFQGASVWTSPDGTPQLEALSTLIADNAKLQGLQVLGPVTFRRSDNGTAVRVVGASDTTAGHVSACGTDNPLVLDGPTFINCNWRAAFLGNLQSHVTQQGAALANEIRTCSQAHLSGQHLDVTYSYDALEHVAEGRGNTTITGKVGSVALNGAPQLVTDGGLDCAGVAAGLDGLACFNAGSIVKGPAIVIRGRITGAVDLSFPPDNGFASSSLDCRGADIANGATLRKDSAGLMVVNMQGVTCLSNAVFTCNGAFMVVDLRGSSVNPVNIATFLNAAVYVDSFSLNVLINAGNPLTLFPFRLANDSYTVYAEAPGIYSVPIRSVTDVNVGSATLVGTYPGRITMN